MKILGLLLFEKVNRFFHEHWMNCFSILFVQTGCVAWQLASLVLQFSKPVPWRWFSIHSFGKLLNIEASLTSFIKTGMEILWGGLMEVIYYAFISQYLFSALSTRKQVKILKAKSWLSWCSKSNWWVRKLTDKSRDCND